MLTNRKRACVAALPLLIAFHCLQAAENPQDLDQLRQITIGRIEQLRTGELPADREELAHHYSELGAQFEGYILNGLPRSEEETQLFYRAAFDAFVASAEYSAMDYGSSSKISAYAVALNDIELLRSYFEPTLASETNENNLYVATMDYASGLEKLGNVEEAEKLLVDAIAMRPRADAYEAKHRYVQLLVGLGRDAEALEVMESMTDEQRNGFNVDLLYLEKSIIERLRLSQP